MLLGMKVGGEEDDRVRGSSKKSLLIITIKEITAAAISAAIQSRPH